MLQYACNCMNVSFETPTSSTSSFVNQQDHLLKSIDKLLLASVPADGTNFNNTKEQIDFVKDYFQNIAVCFEKTYNECPDLKVADHPDYISTFLKIVCLFLISN